MGCELLVVIVGGRIGVYVCFFFQAEDGIRDLVRSRGLGDVYKRQQQKLPVRIILAAELVTAENAASYYFPEEP